GCEPISIVRVGVAQRRRSSTFCADGKTARSSAGRPQWGQPQQAGRGGRLLPADVSCGWIRLDLDRHSEVDPPAGDIGDAADAANAAISGEAGGWRLRLVRVRLRQVAEHLV